MRRNVELEINSANLIKSAAITPLHGRDSNANINIARSAKCRSARTIRSQRGRHSDGALDRLCMRNRPKREIQNRWRLLPARRPGLAVYPNQMSPLPWRGRSMESTASKLALAQRRLPEFSFPPELETRSE